MDKIKYFELYPTYSKEKPIKVSFKDTVPDISSKIPGLIDNNVVLYNFKEAVGIKADIPNEKLLGIEGEIYKDSKGPYERYKRWAKFTGHNYCMIQLGPHETIDFIGIGYIRDNEDKQSKIVTDNGEITLYDLITELKITCASTYSIIENDIFDRVTVGFTGDILYFINDRIVKDLHITSTRYFGSSTAKDLFGLGQRKQEQ